jgi:hypothetical protein
LGPLSVLIVSDDSDLVGGVGGRLAANPSIGSVEAVTADEPWLGADGCVDLVVVDMRRATPSAHVFKRNALLCPQARVLLLCSRNEDVPLGLGRDIHASGYVQPDDAGEIAPVVVALAALSGRD